MTQKVGRPQADNPKSERLFIRVTKTEKEEIMKFSHDTGFSLLELVRLGMKKVEEL